MPLQEAVRAVFGQLADSIALLTPAQYAHPGRQLSQASIGQHVRHIIELFICLEEGYVSGTVDYEKRRRDRRIENDRSLAMTLLDSIGRGLGRENKSLRLEAAYGDESGRPLRFDTNYFREIAYNLEHTIHHMALIRVGIREISDMALPDSYGVAPSTLQYRKVCAQ